MAFPLPTIPPPAPADPRRVGRAIARLRALPAFYPTVQKALRLLDDPATTSAHLQEVIQTDQAVSGRILQLANSAYFGFYARVQTVSLAVALIGREKIATLLHRFLVEEMIHMLSGKKPAARRIREMSVVTAAAAHHMAERLLHPDKEEILIAGLLHNIGDLFFLSQFRSEYEEMLRLADRISRRDAEWTVFGADSPVVGGWLLRAWNLPPSLCTMVERYPDPWAGQFPDAPLAAIAMVHGARRLAECWLLGQQAENACWEAPSRLLSTLEIDRPFLTDVYRRIPETLERLKSTLA